VKRRREKIGLLDLIALVADKDMLFALEGLLARQPDLETHTIRSKVLPHPDHDPGVLNRCHEFLRPYIRLARYALVLFDREGCGRLDSRDDLEELVESRLAQNGWVNRCAAVAIDPVLEVWFWGDPLEVRQALGWNQDAALLNEWLLRRGYLRPGQKKPHRPKDAVRDAWRLANIKPSSSHFGSFARTVNFRGCTDLAFGKLRRVLREWFPLENSREEA
jgi:hypothetical protein